MLNAYVNFRKFLKSTKNLTWNTISTATTVTVSSVYFLMYLDVIYLV